MKRALIFFLCLASLHADVPTHSLANKGALLFSDTFSVPEVGKAWRELWPALTVENGALKIGQSKPEHSAVGMIKAGAKDLIIEFRFRLGAAKTFNAVCNDRDFKEGHGGHLLRVSVSPRQIFLADDKERLSKEIEAMQKDPARKDEVAKRVAGRSVSVPAATSRLRRSGRSRGMDAYDNDAKISACLAVQPVSIAIESPSLSK